MPCWSWDRQLRCEEISLPAGKLRGGLEFWSLQCWVAAVHPVPGASPAFVGIAAPCSDGHLCLLAPCPTSQWGKQFVSLPQLTMCPATGHFNTLALLCPFDIKIHVSCLCLCHMEPTEELLNEYQLSYRISTTFLQRHLLFLFFIYIYICMSLQEFWCKNNK